MRLRAHRLAHLLGQVAVRVLGAGLKSQGSVEVRDVDVALSNHFPQAGEPAGVEVTIRNLSGADATDAAGM